MYSRDLKIAAMREIDSGRRVGEVARHLEVSSESRRTFLRALSANAHQLFGSVFDALDWNHFEVLVAHD
jgi:transposase-like protein